MLTKSKIKDIQSLAGKKQRDEKGLFLLEGPKLVQELLLQHRNLAVEIFANSSWLKENEAMLGRVPFTEVSASQLESISQLSTPNQVLAVARHLPSVAVQAKGTVTLVCAGIQDPGNLGTIIRTADWFGVKQIVCSEDTVDLYNPKVVQSTMGSIFRINLQYTSLYSWIKTLHPLPVYASLLDGKDVRTFSPLTEGLILIGNESKGIPEDLIQLSTHKISIPGKGRAESLNAAVATGIILSYLS